MTSSALPPGPKDLPLVGSVFAFRRDPLTFLRETTAGFGDVVTYRFGRTPVFLLKHPDDIKDVLVTRQHDFVKGRGIQWTRMFLGDGLLTSEGTFHTRQRRLSAPAFHRQRIGAYAAVMADYAQRARAGWRDGETLAFDVEMHALTLAIAGRTLFGEDMLDEASAIGSALTDLLTLFPRFALPWARLLQRLPLPSNRRFERARARLDATVYRIIRLRRQSGRDQGDLLSMLMEVRDEDDGQRMTDVQLRDEIMTLLLAGHETTANALCWTFHLLAQHPEAESRLHAEIDAVLGDRLPGLDDVPRLVYAERVLAEAMRLYPPAWNIGRQSLADHTVRGYTLPAGSLFAVSTWVTHHDERWYPDPFRFDPERFLPDARAARPKFSYFPFGGGARQCIGEQFAWMEGILLMATLAQRFRFRSAPGARVEPQALITLRPRHGLPLVAEARPRVVREEHARAAALA
ncbi:MAG: cytochrome P450 [Vicinamibacteria bacterium]